MQSRSPSFRTRCIAIRRMSPSGSKFPLSMLASSCAAAYKRKSQSPLLNRMAAPPAVVEQIVDHVQSVAPPIKTERKPASDFVPLSQEPRICIPTADAAYHLGRKPQTLRVWACNECGPIAPVRVGGRLMWPVDAIKAFLATPKNQAKAA